MKIEEEGFDDADVAEHIKSDPKKEKKEKLDKKEKELGLSPTTEAKKDPEASIKSTKDLHEELIKNIRDSDSSLRIEVSKLNDDEIDEQIEKHKEDLEVAELRRKGAEDAAKRIKEEDEAEAKAEKAAMAEKEQKSNATPDYSITTSKLEEVVQE